VPKGLKLSRLQLIIFTAVQKAGEHGILSDRLFDAMYNDRIDGGPLSAKVVLRVIVYQLNARLLPFGLQVRAEHTGHGSARNYTLRKL